MRQPPMQTDPADPRAPIAKMLKVLRKGRARALVIPHLGGGRAGLET